MDKPFPLIVDSSVAVKWVNAQNEKLVDEANKIMKNAQEKKILIVMPELAKYEVANALVYKGLPFELLQTAIEDFYYLPIKFIAEDAGLAQINIDIAEKYHMTYYDSSFIALAKKMRGVMVTDNPKHQKKYQEKIPKIISLKDYQ